MDEAQGALYTPEHSLAWLFALGAIVLGVLGLLEGFDILNLRTGEEAAGEGAGLQLTTNFFNGAMLIFSGITSAILAYTLHSSDHHRMRSMSQMNSTDRAMYGSEHSLAYLMALATIALVTIGLLVGFNAFDVANPEMDGLLWIWTGFGSGILAATLHAVRHHQMAETDEIVAIVTERVRLGGEPASRTTTRPTTAPDTTNR
jgi:hypothetical protein